MERLGITAEDIEAALAAAAPAARVESVEDEAVDAPAAEQAPAAARPATTLVVEPLGPTAGLLPAAPVTAPPATPRQQRKKRLGQQNAANAQAALAMPVAAPAEVSVQPEAGGKIERKDERMSAQAEPAPAAAPSATPARRYRNAEGQVWDGEGAMPSWLVRAVNAGQSVEHFRVS